jgi:hypothetical protein
LNSSDADEKSLMVEKGSPGASRNRINVRLATTKTIAIA